MTITIDQLRAALADMGHHPESDTREYRLFAAFADLVQPRASDKPRSIIRDAVTFALQGSAGFTRADWDEIKGKTLEELLSAHVDSLVDWYYDDKPEGEGAYQPYRRCHDWR